MKAYRGKIHISIVTITVCGFAVLTLLFTDIISPLSSKYTTHVLKFKPCPKKNVDTKSSEKLVETNLESNNSLVVDDRLFDFESEECNIANGKWVFNKSIKPLYTDKSCPYLDSHVSCVKNGRLDTSYLHYEWQPDDCTLPRFDPEIVLKKLRGKKLMFVGDSLQKGQWQSFVCMVESVIHEDNKSLIRGRFHSVFTAKEYNATIEFYWAPYLVESNSDNPIIADPKKRILKVDSVAKHAQHWLHKDILVFNTYVWWMSSLKIKALWGSFVNGEQGNEELDMLIGYEIGLKTWANWVDSNVNPNKTRVFFTTMSPTHSRFLDMAATTTSNIGGCSDDDGREDRVTATTVATYRPLAYHMLSPQRLHLHLQQGQNRSQDWGRISETQCFNETKPITKKKFWSSGANKQMMSVVASVVNKMKVHITFINITQLTDYRIDAHSSIYTELLMEERRINLQRYADCIHWCLPGVPDTWNQIFSAYF
ncbi:hypothetical protein ACFE04_012606 [Oxalis oulophora]